MSMKKLKRRSTLNPLRKSPTEDAGWIACNDPMIHARADDLANSLRDMGVRFQNSVMTEASKRINLGACLANILEDSLFYARMYQDTSEEGRKRREEMIDDALIVMKAFFEGGFHK